MSSCFFLFIAFIFFLSLNNQALAVTTYTPMEKIPGFESTPVTDFYSYIATVYNFGIWIIGVSALLMISIGGFMYITAAGNSSSITKAKGVIYDALFGLILALVSYLLLYIINPDLVNLKKISNAPGSIGSGNGQGVSSGSTLPVGCNNYDKNFAEAAGDNNDLRCLLKAVASAESGCNPGAVSPKEACGMMQILPSTAGMTCEALKNSPADSINKAKSILAEYAGKLPATAGGTFGLSKSVDAYGYNMGNDDLIASYNAGTKNTGTGPFEQSVDCPTAGVYKWSCPINPQGFAETQNYVKKVQSLQSQCLKST